MRFFRVSVFACLFFFVSGGSSLAKMPESVPPSQSKGVPIYLYHRFGHEITDRMTVSVARFESQLKKLNEDNRRVIPLRQLVERELRLSEITGCHIVRVTVTD